MATKTFVVMNNPITAYTILTELGNDVLREYIYQSIPSEEFDSHDFTNPFVKDFKANYEEMLEVHRAEGDIKDRNVIISRLIGNYLGNNRVSLEIEKTGETTSLNMNGKISETSKWRKTNKI
jgi:hypothetical protein